MNHDNVSLSFLPEQLFLPAAMARHQRYTGFSQRHDHNQGDQIPAPPPKFGGVIKETPKTPSLWPPTVVPPRGAQPFY